MLGVRSTSRRGLCRVALISGSRRVPASRAGRRGDQDDRDDKLLFFAADGLRQDAVEAYANEGVVPGFNNLLDDGAKASDNGLLTQSPPNTGAGWFTLTTGAWPGVAGSTNNTFHVNGQAFANRTTAFDAGVLQAETLAQAAERGGKKVAQIEWAGGRSGATNGPTLDFRNFRSGRGVATNYISPADSATFTAAFGLQFDHPAGLRQPAAIPTGRAHTGHRLDARAEVVQPADGDAPSCHRRRRRQVRPQRLHLRQQAGFADEVRQGAVLVHEGRQRQGGQPEGRPVGRHQGHHQRHRTRPTR